MGSERMTVKTKRVSKNVKVTFFEKEKDWKQERKPMTEKYNEWDGHDFIKQIQDSNITDKDKAHLCCVLAEGVPFQPDKNMARYIMALVHLEWRNFRPLRDRLIEGLKKELINNDKS